MATTKKKKKHYLVASTDGDWFYTEPYAADSPEEAVEQSESSAAWNQGTEFNVYELASPKPVVVESTIVIQKVKDEE